MATDTREKNWRPSRRPSVWKRVELRPNVRCSLAITLLLPLGKGQNSCSKKQEHFGINKICCLICLVSFASGTKHPAVSTVVNLFSVVSQFGVPTKEKILTWRTCPYSSSSTRSFALPSVPQKKIFFFFLASISLYSAHSLAWYLISSSLYSMHPNYSLSVDVSASSVRTRRGDWRPNDVGNTALRDGKKTL